MTSTLTRPLEGPLSSEKSKLLLHDPLTRSVASAVYDAVLKLFSTLGIVAVESITLPLIYRSIVPPPNPTLGDMAVPCFLVSKSIKKSPAQAAELLAQILEGSAIGSFKNTGPYLNVRIAETSLHEHALHAVLSQKLFERPLTENPPVTMFEFSQPNTHKELHVGHMRNICLGDALARCARYIGIPVVTATFPGDVGTHVARCLWYLKYRNKESIPENNKGAWLGTMYSKGTAQLESEENTPADAENKAALTAILKQLEEKQGEFFDLWKTTREWSLELLNTAYTWAKVSFDRWYWESEFDSPSVSLVKDLYSQGKLIKSEGAIGVDLTAKKLGFCMLLKSDGNGLYATKDFLLAQKKFADFKLDKSIYLVDARQSFHFQQVFAALDAYGFEHAHDCYHLAYNYVELPDGPMSSRKGNIIPLTLLIDRMEQTITERYLSRYTETWTAEEVRHTAQLVGQAAIKFGMNQMEPNTKIVFDMEKWLRLDGDSGPYIQYTCARIRSILRKTSATSMDTFDATLLTTSREREIINALGQFNDVVVRVVETLKTNLLTDYLTTLARLFNAYYAQEKIASDDTIALSNARIALSKAIDIALTKGLSLLGIDTPERM
jgi:arginyl-tRNA synthetase